MILPIIIPTKNRLRLLKQTVESLFANTAIPFHLYLIDDNSDKETTDYLYFLAGKDFVEKGQGQISVVLNQESKGSGARRNKGVQMVYQDYPDHKFIYHSDADMYFLPDWYSPLLSAMVVHPDVAIIGGRKHPHHGVEEVCPDCGLIYSDQQVGMAMLVRRLAFEFVGASFYENTPLEMGGEDTTLCNELRAKNWRIGSVNPPVVLHCGLTNSHGLPTAGAEEEIKQPFPEGVFCE